MAKIVPEVRLNPGEFAIPGSFSLKPWRPPSLATREVRDDRPAITPSREWLWAALVVAFAVLAIVIGS